MKFLFMILLVLPTIFPENKKIISDKESDIRERLAGTWVGVEDGLESDEMQKEEIYIYFDKEGYVTFSSSHDDEVVGGKLFEMDGEMFTMFYRVDESTSIMALEVYMEHIETGIQVTSMTGVFEFLSETSMNLCLDFGEDDVDLSLEDEDCMIFTKR